MKKFLICLIFIINFHAHGETTWIECDIDDEWRKKGNENKLEADYQEYYVVITKEVENKTPEEGAYHFDKITGKLHKVVDESGISLKHIINLRPWNSLNRETLYLERYQRSNGTIINKKNRDVFGKCKLITEAEWMNITQNLIKEAIKGNKF